MALIETEEATGMMGIPSRLLSCFSKRIPPLRNATCFGRKVLAALLDDVQGDWMTEPPRRSCGGFAVPDPPPNIQPIQ